MNEIIAGLTGVAFGAVGKSLAEPLLSPLRAAIERRNERRERIRKLQLYACAHAGEDWRPWRRWDVRGMSSGEVVWRRCRPFWWRWMRLPSRSWRTGAVTLVVEDRDRYFDKRVVWDEDLRAFVSVIASRESA